ncbi:MAG: hypothetical protein KF862_07815 [Chitinophagaceae bacterium]|nr:hypothetical protein [Chitinophagaceae bacterium]
MLKRKFARRRYTFLFAAGAIVIVFAAFSFTQKGERPFRGFYEDEIQNRNDTLPRKQPRTGDDTGIPDTGMTGWQIEEALRRVEEKLSGLEAELQGRLDDIYSKESFQLAFDNRRLKQLKDETRSSLLMAQAQYDKAMRKLDMENKKSMLHMQLQLDKAQQLAFNHNRNLHLELENKVKVNLEKAKDNMKKANEKLQQLRSFKDDLEKDGLIKKGASYTIEIKGGSLYINGERQSQKVNKKYKNKYGEYFEEWNNFKLQSNDREYRREKERGLI